MATQTVAHTRTWDHEIVPIPAVRIAEFEAQDRRWQEEDARRPEGSRWYRPGLLLTCRVSRKCGGRIAYYLRYAYVTGRRGRVTDAERHACRFHAEVFAKRHGLSVPEAA